MEIPTKEIQAYTAEVLKAENYAGTLKIVSAEDYTSALGEGKAIKEKLDLYIARKEEITKPLNAALKSVRDLFKPIETAGDNALRTIKQKMLAYTAEQTRKAEEAKIKLAERVERGTMKVETAVRKIEEIKAPEKTVATDEAKAVTKTVIKYRVTDKTKIPLEFMEPDMVAIKASFKKGVSVPGCEAYEEKELTLI